MNDVAKVIRFKEKPAFSVMGVQDRVKLGTDQIMKAWTGLMEQKCRIQGQVESDIYYGVMDNYDTETTEFDYLASVKVDGKHVAPEGLVKWEVPVQSYAVFETTMPVLADAFHYIYGEWMQTSGYERPDGPDYEYYGADYNAEQPDSTIYLYIPVRKK